MSGWIKLHRTIRDNWLYKEKRTFSRFEAWIDLLLEANHKDNRFPLGNEIVECKRGQLITSIRELCGRWNWSNTKVKNFLNLLQNDNMIDYFSDTKKTVITIENYDIYQRTNDTETFQERHESDTKATRKHTNKNVKNDKKYIDDDLETDQDDIPVADVSADLTQQEESESDLKRIEQHYIQKLSRLTGSKDLQAMTQVYEQGYPADFIIRCIDIGCERYQKANGKLDINSFKYFVPIIEDEWVKKKAREEGEKATPGSPPTVQRKKAQPKRNRFNNFEQQSSKYSKDELEKLFRSN